MTAGSLHDFFEASAGVAGALIGLLFVAISVAGERLNEQDEMHINRVRAHAALIAFVNALVVSLFALIQDESLGNAILAESIIGFLFVAGSLWSLIRRRKSVTQTRSLDAIFLLGLLTAFITQLIMGLQLGVHPDDAGMLRSTATLTIVFFLIGINRSWEVIGAPSTGLGHEIEEQLLQIIERRRPRQADKCGSQHSPEVVSHSQASPDD